MLKTSLQEEVESYESGLHLIALNMRSGPQHRYTMVERLPMATETDYVDWLARLENLPAQLAQYQALLQAGVDRERTQARIIIERVPNQLDALIVDNPEDSPFWGVFETMPASISPESAAELKSSARVIIADQLTPAYASSNASSRKNTFQDTSAPGYWHPPRWQGGVCDVGETLHHNRHDP